MKDDVERWFTGLVVVALAVAIFNPLLGAAIFGIPLFIAVCISAKNNKDK